MIDWEKIRKQKYALEDSPEDWPQNVRPISLDGVTLFGVHQKTGELYWDGQQVKVIKRFSWWERSIGIIVAAGTFLGGVGGFGLFALKVFF